MRPTGPETRNYVHATKAPTVGRRKSSRAIYRVHRTTIDSNDSIARSPVRRRTCRRPVGWSSKCELIKGPATGGISHRKRPRRNGEKTRCDARNGLPTAGAGDMLPTGCAADTTEGAEFDVWLWARGKTCYHNFEYYVGNILRIRAMLSGKAAHNRRSATFNVRV